LNDHGYAWATLIVNYVGSVLLAILLVYSDNHRSPKWWWRPALGAGFCGGFTTYSAFAVRIDQYLNDGNYGSAISYTLASLVGSYFLVFVTVKIMKSRQVQG
jgi:CrcB protein